MSIFISVRNSVRKILGKRLSRNLKKVYMTINFCVVYPLYHKFIVYFIKRKECINVLFVASTLSMWRYQEIYNLMSKHTRFNPSIVIVPFASYSKEQQRNDIAKLRQHFDELSIEYNIGGEMNYMCIKELCPDIIFYPQPYDGLYENQYNYLNYRNRLLCYYPYAFWNATGEWSYNLPFHNYAWKLLYSTELHKKEAQKYAYNRGGNVEVVGYPNADEFMKDNHQDIWKVKVGEKKRIIWAPHFTIFPEGLMTQSNFLWMADFMLELVDIYSEKLHFVFKPHPRLMTELFNHEDWGKERTIAYYKAWTTKDNAQLEDGEYVDLFMTSNAMIHDCGSFCIEYHYSGNPVMFVSKDFEALVSEKGHLGQLAMRQHYVGKCKKDIINFIENVVLKGEDSMKAGRKDFYKKYLLPPNGKTVAENTMDVFLKAFC